MSENLDESLRAKLIDTKESSNEQSSDLQGNNDNGAESGEEEQWNQSAILTLALCWALTL
jgi:hypothetical protein